MADKPPIPDVADARAVARWFVEYDDALRNLRTNCPSMKDSVVDDVRLIVQSCPDVTRLKRHYRRLSSQWSTDLLPKVAARYQRGPPFSAFDKVIFSIESSYEAKKRILGYILRERYGVPIED
jgi:hypothetical protein